jgi:hypothetical protein
MISHTTAYEEDFFKNYYDKQLSVRWYTLKNTKENTTSVCPSCGFNLDKGYLVCNSVSCPYQVAVTC